MNKCDKFRGQVNKSCEVWWLVLTNSLIGYGITWEMGFWARLWEIILITWTEVGRSSYWGQNYSFVWDCGLYTMKRANRALAFIHSLLLTVDIIEPAALSSFYLDSETMTMVSQNKPYLINLLTWEDFITTTMQWLNSTLARIFHCLYCHNLYNKFLSLIT